jgi:hypothetical protein
VRGVAPRGAVVRLSPLWVSTPVGENLIEKGHDPWEAQQVEHSAAGVSMSPQGHQKVLVRSLCECTEGDKEWVPLPRRPAHGFPTDVLRSPGQRRRR